MYIKDSYYLKKVRELDCSRYYNINQEGILQSTNLKILNDSNNPK